MRLHNAVFVECLVRLLMWPGRARGRASLTHEAASCQDRCSANKKRPSGRSASATEQRIIPTCGERAPSVFSTSTEITQRNTSPRHEKGASPKRNQHRSPSRSPRLLSNRQNTLQSPHLSDDPPTHLSTTPLHDVLALYAQHPIPSNPIGTLKPHRTNPPQPS